MRGEGREANGVPLLARLLLDESGRGIRVLTAGLQVVICFVNEEHRSRNASNL